MTTIFTDEDGAISKYDVPDIETWADRPNPSITGCRYMLTEHGKSIRSRWAVPKSQKKEDHILGSANGCKKKRFTLIGHRQRAGLWLVVCLRHQTVVGYHVMESGEGRRDAFLPLYRFKEHPPAAFFSDYVCGIEETDLNLQPEFWKHTSFYHDLFHGFAHKCSKRFMSRRHEQFSSLNTSLMEQVFITHFWKNKNYYYFFKQKIVTNI